MKIQTGKSRASSAPDHGSAILVAIFALALMTSVGLALLFLGDVDQRINMVDHDVKQGFYGAEAALEDGREQLRKWNLASGTLALGDELDRAAGANNVIDIDPGQVAPIVDSNGNLTGFTNVGDDEPLQGIRTFGNGWVASYLTNDPAEGRTNLTDADKKVTVVGLSYTENGSFELVDAIVHSDGLVPTPPATITILGPAPTFTGGNSNAKKLTGNDCDGLGQPGLAVPVVGVIGPLGEALAETGVDKPATYSEGAESGVDTVDDIDGTIDARWTDCSYLSWIASRVRDIADVVGDENTPEAMLGTPGNEKIVFIDDDYEVPGNFSGAGVLWVTGKFEIKGNFSWQGPIFVIGIGEFLRSGGGTADISGGTVVANVSGPDDSLWTGDDCSGPDGSNGTPDDGIAESSYDVNGAGAGDTVYCTEHLKELPLRWPFELLDFRQR